MILSSFYWGYTLSHIAGGQLSEWFGGKYVLGVAGLSTGILTLLTPIVVELYDSTGLIFLRFLVGIGEGPMFPAVSELIAHWAPPQERTRISTMVTSGIPIGTMLGNALSGILIQYSSIGWPVVFDFFGSCAILWFFAWVVLCYSYPDLHPFITDKERKYIRESTCQHTQRYRHPTPWRQMMTSGPLWALLIGNIGFSWGFFTMISDLPKYMSEVLKFSIQANGFLSAFPHILTWFIANASSWLSDWLVKNEMVSTGTARKFVNTVAAVLSSVFVIAASYAGCDRKLVLIFFTIGVGMMGFYYPSMMVNPNDLSPNYSGSVKAIVSTVGSLTGVVAPFVAGVLTPNHTLSEWRIVFWVTLSISLGSSLIFAVWGDGEVQEWNSQEPGDQRAVELDRRRASALVYCVGSEQSDGRYIQSEITGRADHLNRF